MGWKIMVIASLEREFNGPTAITSQVIEFQTQELADQAVASIEAWDYNESYAQLEAVKLYQHDF